MTDATSISPTIVLVHGAWADASCWNGVIASLGDDGYTVIAPANPLRGVMSDSVYIASVLDSIPGPIILVGHYVRWHGDHQCRRADEEHVD